MIIRNLIDILIFQAKNNPEKIAVFTQDKNITFFELEKYVCKVANYLETQNVKSKDIVLHSFNDEFLLIVTMLALAKIGACLVSVSKNIPKIQLDEIKEIINPKFLLSDEDMNLYFEINKIIFTNNLFSSLNNTYYKNIEEFDPDITWQIVVGSGTTGKAKFFKVSHKLELERIKISKQSINITENDILLSLLELKYNSTKIRFLAGLYSGASYVILNREHKSLLDFCIKQKITILYTTVFHVENIFKTIPNMIDNVLCFLRVLSIGASNISDELRKKIQTKLTSDLYIGYGTNDIGGITCTNPKSVFSISQTVGKAINGVEVQIVDENEKEKAVGEIGFIRVKSPGMIDRYLNDEEATKKAFRNGWFYPGDLGKLTEDEELIYCGRSDQMMIMNGINIYPVQIENIIISHESVKDAVVFPIKHQIHQDIPICVVVLKENKQISKSELMNYCLERLGFSSPKEIIFLDEIPRNEQGKIVREKLRQKISMNQIEIKNKKDYKIDFQIENEINLNLLKEWFTDILNLDISEIEEKDLILFISKYAIKLATYLFQTCQIPIFEDSKIISLNVDKIQKNRFSLVISYEYIDFISNKHYFDIINNSFNYMLWMAKNQVTLKNREILFSEISRELVNPILSQMPPGKSRIHILKEAFRKNIPFYHLGDGVYQFGCGSKSRKMDRSTIDSDSAMGSKLSQNKIFTANILKMAGLPAPIHGVTSNKEEALSISNQITYPIVVKPVDLDRGEGVSVNIFNENDLIKAFELAYKLSKTKQVIIEKQVTGICHRLFIINNKLLYAVKRLPISILSDGENKIEVLIKKANQKEFLKTPWDYTRQYFPDDELAIETLKKLSYTLESIPQKDILIPLRDIESTQWGGIDEDVTNMIHPDNLKIAFQATNLFELKVAGIDIITTDISKPWYETDAIINEVNFAPLLGGGDISRKKIGEFLDLLLKDDGRIPIEQYNDELKALNRQKELILEGVKAYFISNEKVIDYENSLLIFKNYTFSQKMKALLLNKNVDLIIIFSL